MYRYISQRLTIMIPTVLGITILIFLTMRVLPGDPLALIMSESAGSYVLSDEELAAARASLGLDKPYYVQYLQWMGEVARGELGSSFWTNEPIRDLILRRGPIGDVAEGRRHRVLRARDRIGVRRRSRERQRETAGDEVHDRVLPRARAGARARQHRRERVSRVPTRSGSCEPPR